MLLCESADSRRSKDAKAINLFATALEIDSVDPHPRHRDIAVKIKESWPRLTEREPRTLEQAKLNLVRRFGDAARTISQRRHAASPGGRPGAGRGADGAAEAPAPPAYLEFFEIGCCERSYPVRLAIAQEIGAGGDDALADLETLFTPLRPSAGHPTEASGNGQTQPADSQRNQRGSFAYHGQLGQIKQNQQERQDNQEAGEEQRAESAEETRRREVMRAWLAPLLVGSAVTRRPQAIAELGQLLEFVHGQNRLPDRDRADLSVEIGLAQGFKYAANRRREHPQARDAARSHLRQQAREMLSACSFWFTRLTLVQALTLRYLPDGPSSQPDPDFRALVAHWAGMPGLRHRDARNEHPFVTQACRLAVRALETGRPERYIWIDESGIVSKVGSSPAKPHSRRKHNLWIPPSTGWTALNTRAQQLVADVLLLLNLAERGDPVQRDRRLGGTNRNDLPPCMAEDRSLLDPGRLLGMVGDFEPGSKCKTGCGFGFCPYPPKGAQSHRQELTEAFCRRQQRLLAWRPFRARAAPWQQAPVRQLKRFWKDLGQPLTHSEPEDTSRARPQGRR